MAATMAHAQEWPQLPDGRVVISVKGISLALPSQGSSLNDIRFYISTNQTKQMKLGEVIAHPDRARRFFLSSRDVFFVLIPASKEGADLFLGRFDRKVVNDFLFSIGLSTGSGANCRAWLDTNNKYRERLAAEHVPIAADGWAEFIQPKSPPTWHYIRAHDIPGLPKHFESFRCD